MSRALSPSGKKPYGLARVCRAWGIPRSTVYDRRVQAVRNEGGHVPAKRGPKEGILPDAELLERIRGGIAGSPWVGEGYRKVWARLRRDGVRTSQRRVLRLMRENGLLAPTRSGVAHGPKAHDGTITTERPDEMWGTDATSVLVDEGHATVFLVVDHCTAECLGLHAAVGGNRFDALEALRQAVRATRGGFEAGIARGTALRHDHGSQFVSHAYQEEVRFLGIASSPAFVREPQGNGCAERFVRTLKEQLLWIRRFRTIDELNAALQEFRHRYNEEWIVQRLGHAGPAAHRRKLVA